MPRMDSSEHPSCSPSTETQSLAISLLPALAKRVFSARFALFPCMRALVRVDGWVNVSDAFVPFVHVPGGTHAK